MPRPYVTIGHQHRGPHVDALYALAERHGATVIVVGRDGEVSETGEPYKRARVLYAGYDEHDAARFRRMGDAR